MYLEGHLNAYINSSLVADSDTKEALECAVKRENVWVNKSSTIVQCKEILAEMREEDQCFIPIPENTTTYEAPMKVEKPKIMKAAKEKVKQIFCDKAEHEAGRLPFQGGMISLMAQEKEECPEV